LGWFETVPPAGVRLRGAYRAHGSALAARASRAAVVVRDWRDRHGAALVGPLARAGAPANQGPFFEGHGVLHPGWFRAPEPERTALQGLIQVAVAFHHVENGNREGARSLLALGQGKLVEAGSALPLQLGEWLEELRAILLSLSAGACPPPTPRWPSPA